MEVNKRIINKLKERDNDTFELVYYEYKDLVYFVAFSVLNNHNDTEEIVQDVFVKMLKELDKFDGRFFKAWLLKMTKNLAINKYRLNNKEDSLSDEELGNFSSIDEFKQRDYLMEIEELLDEQSFKVVVLHLVYGLKHRETAEYLNIPLGTVCTLFNNAVKKLKKIYSERK